MLQQTYYGYFEDGRFISPDKVTIPDRMPVTVTLDSDKIPQMIDGVIKPQKTLAQRQNEALREFSAAMKEITDEPLDAEFDAIVSKRVNIARALDL